MLSFFFMHRTCERPVICPAAAAVRITVCSEHYRNASCSCRAALEAMLMLIKIFSKKQLEKFASINYNLYICIVIKKYR